MNPEVPAPAAALLNFIAGYESKGNYLAYYGHSNNSDPLPKTLDDVLLFQANLISVHHQRSSATGRYQFMPRTLRSLMDRYKIKGTEPFTNDLQDLLAYYLLQLRGYAKWMAGDRSDSNFADSLSQEWASLPYHTGKSYYDGDGLNHALVSRDLFMSVITKAKAAQSVPAAQTPTPAQKENPMGGLLGSVASIIEGVISKGTTVASVASVVPNIVEGAFKSIDEAKRGFDALTRLATDIRTGKWDDVENAVEAIIVEFKTIMTNFGINHDGLNTATTKLATTPPVNS